jgi:hypothetical protein
MRSRAKLGRVTKDYLGGLARRRELAGDGTELDSMRQRVGIVEAVPDPEQPHFPRKRSRRCVQLAGSPPRPLQLPIIPPTSPSACALARRRRRLMALSYRETRTAEG